MVETLFRKKVLQKEINKIMADDLRKKKIKSQAKKAKGWLGKIKTYKSKEKPFPGSLGVGISVIRKRKKRLKEMEEKLGF